MLCADFSHTALVNVIMHWLNVCCSVLPFMAGEGGGLSISLPDQYTDLYSGVGSLTTV